jgi:RNA polymerase sigma-70 factor (ECF subfamily)
MDESYERSIIKKLKAGDIGALTPLVKAYQHRALRAAYLVLQDQELAKDVTQAAFLRAYERIHQFDTNRRFLPWFLRIVVNMSVQMAQKQSRTTSLEGISHADDESWIDTLLSEYKPDPETQLEMRELEQEIHSMLKQLSPDKRAVVVLRYYVDMTEVEMSKLLSVPPGTIKSRLHTARRQLRRLLSLHST